MLRTSIASLACLALCAPIAWAQTTEKAPKSTKEASRPSSSSSRPPSSPPRAPTETKAKTPERSMTMQQEEAARLAKQRREEEEARRALYHQQKQHRDRAPTETRARTPDRSMTMQQEEAARLAKQRREEEELRRALYRQQQDNLRGQRFYPAPVIVEPVPQQQQQPQASPGLGAVGPVTAPATTPAPSRDIVVSCSAAPACAGAVCRSVASTYGGGNAASVGRRDIVTLCQQANSADACCIQECASTAICAAR